MLRSIERGILHKQLKGCHNNCALERSDKQKSRLEITTADREAYESSDKKKGPPAVRSSLSFFSSVCKRPVRVLAPAVRQKSTSREILCSTSRATRDAGGKKKTTGIALEPVRDMCPVLPSLVRITAVSSVRYR